MDAVALEAHEAQVQALIEYDSLSVELKRLARTSDGAGGWIDNAEATLAAQTFRLVPLQVAQDRTEAGDLDVEEFTLVGLRSADVKKGDWWTAGGFTYRVTGNVDVSNKWGTRATVRKEA